MIKPFIYQLLLFLICSGNLWGQDTITANLAEPFKWKIKKGAAQTIPSVGQNLGGFEILAINQANDSGVFDVLLVAYDTGNLRLPVNMGSPDLESILIRVNAPLPEKIKKYSPVIEPAFSRPENKFPLWIPLLATFIILVTGFVYWFKTRKKSEPAEPVFIPGGTEILLGLKEKWASGSLSSLELGEGLLKSLESQYNVPVKKSTRQLGRLIRRKNPGAFNPNVENALRQTDAWRFGKQVATRQEGVAAISHLETLFLSEKAEKINKD